MSRRRVIVLATLAIVAILAVLALGRSRGPVTEVADSGGPTAAGASPSSEPGGSVLSTGSPSFEPSADHDPSPTPHSVPGPGTSIGLPALLGLLRIEPETRTGYARRLFVHWIDADGDGCDTRREVLLEEAVVRPTVGPDCFLTGGTWLSLYDSMVLTSPDDLQIDHVVALAEAWDSGASSWSSERRKAFANDLDAWFALIAVSGTSNQSKSDRDPADWLPPSPTATCDFLGAWIATKVRWALAVDQVEHDVLARDVADCRSATMPYLPAGDQGGGAAGTPEPGPSAPRPAGSAGAACDASYPTVCIEPAPPDLDCPDVPFRDFAVLPPDPHRFDGDNDGVGCET